jgi:hypothetical protein
MIIFLQKKKSNGQKIIFQRKKNILSNNVQVKHSSENDYEHICILITS